MPRTPLTRAQREDGVIDAFLALDDAIARAQLAERGADPAAALRAWAIVEAHGATIHRQSRLMAGKSKGG